MTDRLQGIRVRRRWVCLDLWPLGVKCPFNRSCRPVWGLYRCRGEVSPGAGWPDPIWGHKSTCPLAEIHLFKI